MAASTTETDVRTSATVPEAPIRIAFDSGGTFTDLVIQPATGPLITAKLLSMFEDVGTSIVRLATQAGSTGSTQAVHATTVVTNAVLQNRVARTGLLTTRGFRDDLEMREQRRPNVFDMNWERLPPLIPRELRLEVDEAIRADGSVEVALDVEQARRMIEQLLAAGVCAIAVSLINAYVNPKHERAIGELIREIGPDIAVSLSTDVHCEIGEYQRTSTAAINASLIPVFDGYMDTLGAQLGEMGRRLLIMRSNGGITTAANARRLPAHIVESGPAAGVLAAARLAQTAGLDRVMSFDMGGTTAKACFIEAGAALEKPSGEIGGEATIATRLFGGGGHALRVPSLDIAEVGAGGGSIAWVDESGILRVGPQSAGAVPGPVCYGRGGGEPTVTDANVVLGYISPVSIAGSEIHIDRDAALDAIRRQIAVPASLDIYAAALGIFKVANATMMRALRAVSNERGRDPRESTLVAFGGAGPIHATQLAASLGIRSVVVPLHAGLFSAQGLLLADFRHDEIRSLAAPLDQIDVSDLDTRWFHMEASARAAMSAQGVAGGLRLERFADMKYRFQAEHLTVAFPNAVTSEEIVGRLADRFRQVHDESFGHVAADTIEVVNLRLRVSAAAGTTGNARDVGERPVQSAVEPNRAAYFEGVGLRSVRILRRDDIAARVAGPFIIEESDTTIVVPPGWEARCDADGNLHLTMEARG